MVGGPPAKEGGFKNILGLLCRYDDDSFSYLFDINYQLNFKNMEKTIIAKGKEYSWKEWLTIFANQQSYTPKEDYIDILVKDFEATKEEAEKCFKEWQAL